jgi:hypothetical protein
MVEGAIVGRQGPPGNGGLLTSDRQFGDIEISLETSDEWDSDSGLFLRTTPEGAAYQVMIDLYPGGTVGGLWGEALPETLDIRRFVFAESGHALAPQLEHAPRSHHGQSPAHHDVAQWGGGRRLPGYRAPASRPRCRGAPGAWRRSAQHRGRPLP